MRKDLICAAVGIAVIAGGVGYFAAPPTRIVEVASRSAPNTTGHLAIDRAKPKTGTNSTERPVKVEVYDDTGVLTPEGMREEAEANYRPDLVNKYYDDVIADKRNKFLDVAANADSREKAELFRDTAQVFNIGEGFTFNDTPIVEFFACQAHNCSDANNMILIDEYTGDEYARNQTDGVGTIIRDTNNPILLAYADKRIRELDGERVKMGK